MSPLRRNPVNKQSSANSFKNQVRRTKGANLSNPARGGIRL